VTGVQTCALPISGDILDELVKRYPCLRVINHGKNKGYGQAIKTGLRSCTKEMIFYTDGDGQYDVKEMPHLLESIEGFDMVNGYIDKRSDPFYRITLGKIYAKLLKIILNINIRYVDCDYRLFKRCVIGDLKLESDGGFICAEMLKRIIDRGYKIKEVRVSHYARKSGKSQFFRVRNITGLLMDFARFSLTYKAPENEHRNCI
jgi:glycosyltransferase involved in cell wall biosynthesis